MMRYLDTSQSRPSLQRKIDGIRTEIACAQRKRQGIGNAIEDRQRTLARLEAQLALCDEPGQVCAVSG